MDRGAWWAAVSPQGHTVRRDEAHTTAATTQHAPWGTAAVGRCSVAPLPEGALTPAYLTVQLRNRSGGCPL